MGKNKKQTKTSKQVQQPVSMTEQVPVVQTEQVKEEVEEKETQELVITPKEKADQYLAMQMEIYEKFVNDFKEEEISLLSDPRLEEKFKDFEKREKEEFKKLEKVFKKESLEMEELQQNSNAQNPLHLKAIRDRIARLITENNKTQKAVAKIQSMANDSNLQIEKIKTETAGSISKKGMLQGLCKSLLDQNYQLYLKHETMLEQEQEERKKLASMFQEQMKGVTADLERQKVQRNGELNENTQIREKIQEAISAYKKKEEAFRAKMNEQGQYVKGIELKLKTAIEDTIGTSLKVLETEKGKYHKVAENIGDLTNKINLYVEKFDKIKDDMDVNQKKFSAYNSDVETKTLKIQVLETEIINIQLTKQKQALQEKEMEEEKKRMNDQVETFRSLRAALQIQLKGIQDSNKENASVINS